MTVRDSIAEYIARICMPRILRPHLRWDVKTPANDHDNAPSAA